MDQRVIRAEEIVVFVTWPADSTESQYVAAPLAFDLGCPLLATYHAWILSGLYSEKYWHVNNDAYYYNISQVLNFKF